MTEYDENQKQVVLEALVRRARTISAEQKASGEELKALRARISELVEVGWTLVVDGIKAQKSFSNRVFSPELAVARFKPEELERCKAEGLDPKKIADMAVALGIKEACMVAPDNDTGSVKLA